MIKRIPLALAPFLLAGCFNWSNLTSDPAGVSSTAVIPPTNVNVGPTATITLEKIVYWAGVGAIAYLVLDPLSPNWEIEEAQFPNNHYHLSLKMKRYYAGGAGEARVVFNRRAKELANTGGFSGYKILEYSEGMESSVIGSQRVTEGVVVLTGPVASSANLPATSR